METQTIGESNKKPVGPVIGLVIILVIIIIGGLYFWTTRKTYAPQQEFTVPAEQASTTDEINQQNTSDDINSIEADLGSFNEASIDNVDSGL